MDLRTHDLKKEHPENTHPAWYNTFTPMYLSNTLVVEVI